MRSTSEMCLVMGSSWENNEKKKIREATAFQIECLTKPKHNRFVKSQRATHLTND